MNNSSPIERVAGKEGVYGSEGSAKKRARPLGSKDFSKVMSRGEKAPETNDEPLLLKKTAGKKKFADLGEIADGTDEGQMEESEMEAAGKSKVASEKLPLGTEQPDKGEALFSKNSPERKNVQQNYLSPPNDQDDLIAEEEAKLNKPGSSGMSSIFDLSKGSETAEKDIPLATGKQPQLPVQQGILGANTAEQVAKESPFDLFTQSSSKEKLKSLGLQSQSPEDNEEIASLQEKQRRTDIEKTFGQGFFQGRQSSQTANVDMDETTKASISRNTNADLIKKRPNTQFTRETPDLSYINPMQAAQQPISAEDIKSKDKPASIPSHIQEIIDQIVHKIYTLNVDGRTETTVTLKHPPMFAGAHVVLTTYDTAKGEFNIAFENLTPEAKRLLDMQENQKSLKLALEEKGYAMHIMTTTTAVETAAPVYLEEERFTRKDEREEQGKKQQQNQEEEG